MFILRRSLHNYYLNQVSQRSLASYHDNSFHGDSSYGNTLNGGEFSPMEVDKENSFGESFILLKLLQQTNLSAC